MTVARPLPGAVAVIAKTPRPGRVKTRLSPPLSPAQASEVAWACLTDTLEAVARVPSRRHVVLLDGAAGEWVPPGFEVVHQRGAGLTDRLANGFADIGDTGVIIAMDTPQVDSAVLAEALGALEARHDSAFGPATDGGYWLIGLRAGLDAAAVFKDIPMGTSATGATQLERLHALGLSPLVLGELRDVDTIDDVVAIALAFPSSRLGRLARTLDGGATLEVGDQSSRSSTIARAMSGRRV